MEYTVTAKYIRISPRKMRLLADAVRHMSPVGAIGKLRMATKRAARPLVRALESGIAQAKGRNVSADALRISSLDVLEGPAMKRWRAVSRGMAHPYKKRMTHLRIVLTDEGGNINKSTNKQISK